MFVTGPRNKDAGVVRELLAHEASSTIAHKAARSKNETGLVAGALAAVRLHAPLGHVQRRQEYVASKLLRVHVDVGEQDARAPLPRHNERQQE